jgi:hypothetical protein
MRSKALVLIAALSAASAAADPTKATLVLDGLSFISFGDEQLYSIPEGSVIVFRFGELYGSTASFELHPDDFNWPPLPLRGSDASMRFGLAAPAKGTVSFAPDGTGTLAFEARVRVQIDDRIDSRMKEISIRFTTEAQTAVSLDGAKSIPVAGMRLGRTSRAIQLVGARTNHADDYPEPGAAVYAVLSGTFDVLPTPTGGAR